MDFGKKFTNWRTCQEQVLVWDKWRSWEQVRVPSRTCVSESPNLSDRINIKLISFSIYLFTKPDFLNKSFFFLIHKKANSWFEHYNWFGEKKDSEAWRANHSMWIRKKIETAKDLGLVQVTSRQECSFLNINLSFNIHKILDDVEDNIQNFHSGT